jgi:hypothetical protein
VFSPPSPREAERNEGEVKKRKLPITHKQLMQDPGYVKEWDKLVREELKLQASFMDCFDWSIRQAQSLGYIGMRQMVLVLRLMTESRGRKKRFSDSMVRKMCTRDIK